MPPIINPLNPLNPLNNNLNNGNTLGIGEIKKHGNTYNNYVETRMNLAKYKTKPCRNYHSSVGCSRGDACHFIHDPDYAGTEIKCFNLSKYKSSSSSNGNTINVTSQQSKTNESDNMSVEEDNDSVEKKQAIIPNYPVNPATPHMMMNPNFLRMPVMPMIQNPAMPRPGFIPPGYLNPYFYMKMMMNNQNANANQNTTTNTQEGQK
jgi:hypothetical protein